MRLKVPVLAGLVLLAACGADDAATSVDDVGATDTAGDADATSDSGFGVTDSGGALDGSADGSGVGPAFGELPDEFVPTGDEFMVVYLPDTQIYAEQFPETFQSQLRWIAEHAAEYRIVFVSHVGDIVQTAGVRSEWDVARAAYDWIEDIGLPHGFSIGGHDTSGGITRPFDNSCSPFPNTDCASVDFMMTFGPEFYVDRPWYGGASPSGRSSYQVVEVNGWQLLFLHMIQDTPASEVEWANEVLDAHPGALAHLTTHRYLFDYRLTDYLPVPLSALPAGRFNPLVYTLGGQSLMFNDGLQADQLFAQLVNRHPNIWTVHCGHVDAEFHRTATNSAGLPVHEVLIDFQDMADGGGGWLRLMRYRPSDNQVDAITFSTVTGRVRGNGEGFDHSIEILTYYKNAYGEDLEAFGLDAEELEELLRQVAQPGEMRDDYYASLYDDGKRDSVFVLDVDFEAHMASTR